MSLAVLARKTKTQQRLRSTKCGSKSGGRTAGFVLNMTGRGGGIGLSGMSYKQRGVSCRKYPYKTLGCQCKGCCSDGGRCKTGQAGTCCAGDQRVSKKCRDDCGLCWYGGMSQPAPQMSYRNYINRKANGAYRPGGKVCCSKAEKCQQIFDLYPLDMTVVIVQGQGVERPFSGMTGFNKLKDAKVTNPTNQQKYTLKTFGKSDSPDIQAFFFYNWIGDTSGKTYLYIKASPHVKSIVLENGSTIKLHHYSPYYPLEGNESYFKHLIGQYRPEGIQERATIIPPSSTCRKPQVTWKQSPDIAASTITEHRAQATIRCASNLIKRNPVFLGGTRISNRITAKPVCSWYNPETCKYETVKGPNPLTQNNQCTTTLPIRGRLGYTRINKNWCNTTKTLTVGASSSEQIAKRKQRAFLCPCGPKQDTCTPECDGENNVVNLGVVDYGSGGYSITNGPTKLCRCNTTFVLNFTNQAKVNGPHYISVINPRSVTPWLEDEGPWINNPLAIKVGDEYSLVNKFTIPAAWCEAGYKKLYFFEVSNPPSDFAEEISWDICAPNCDNEKRETARYCYPRPFHTGKNCGLSLGLTRQQKEACRLGCPKHWNSGNLRLR